MQYGGLLSVRNRRVSILNSNPLWGPRKNYAVPLGMIGTALIAVVNLYGKGFQVGYTYYFFPGLAPRLGVNVQLAMRYAGVATNDTRYASENSSFYLLYFPETIGLRWRF